MAGRKRLHPPAPDAIAFALGLGGSAMTGSALPRRPGLANPTDGFVLADHVPADGDLSLAQAVKEVLDDWAVQVATDRIDATTIRGYSDVIRTLLKYATNSNITLVKELGSDLMWRWVNSPATGTRAAEYPSENMRKQRRASVRALYKTWYRLGITETNIAASLPPIANTKRKVSAFTAAEIQALKDHADYDIQGRTYRAGSTVTPACLALALLGAQSGEFGAIRFKDIDQLNKAVFLHGGGSRFHERWVPIDDDWAWEALLDRLAYLAKTQPNNPDALLAYQPRDAANASDFMKRSAATARTLTVLMESAGVYRKGNNRVASINEYVAARVFDETGRVEAVAARLGMNSLDSAAHLVGYDWRTHYNPDPRDIHADEQQATNPGEVS